MSDPKTTPAPAVSVSGISAAAPIRATVECLQCGHVESIETRGSLGVAKCPKCGNGGVRVVDLRVG